MPQNTLEKTRTKSASVPEQVSFGPYCAGRCLFHKWRREMLQCWLYLGWRLERGPQCYHIGLRKAGSIFRIKHWVVDSKCHTHGGWIKIQYKGVKIQSEMMKRRSGNYHDTRKTPMCILEVRYRI